MIKNIKKAILPVNYATVMQWTVDLSIFII